MSFSPFLFCSEALLGEGRYRSLLIFFDLLSRHTRIAKDHRQLKERVRFLVEE